MSVQLGTWNCDRRPVDESYIEKVNSLISPYGPDGCTSFSQEHIKILYHAFHTTRESRHEAQPHVSPFGVVITWNGRLDARAELIRDLGAVLTADPTDVEIVAAAYERWGTDCFARLIGDWALSIWHSSTESLILARDAIGLRPIYYSIERDRVTWSTILDPLVQYAERVFTLSEEYIAGWLSFFPAAHLTPYVGIHCVPPSSFILLRQGEHTITKYWDFDPGKRIRYATDGEYQEHFRTVFAEAVRCRLRSDAPVLAELSGGMDSSSIVCVADTIIASGAAHSPRLDTISFYNDSEPNWNERPYFSKVEEKRGRSGCHIDVSSQERFNFDSHNGHFEATPACTTDRNSEATKQFESFIRANGNRVVLSGIGGDEAMGGVPTPTPQLQDLLARGQARELAHQLKLWALSKRVPWFRLLHDAIREFFPLSLVGVPTMNRPVPWLNSDFVKRNKVALQGYERRVRLGRTLPSFQANICTLDNLRRQLGCSSISSDPPYEKRYPFLDRGLLEFLYSIPRDQLVRPGRRRFLMRAALAGIVPDDIIERKRKAFVARGTRSAITTEWPSLADLSEHMSSASLGIIDQAAFVASLQKARNSEDVPLVRLMRTIFAEVWLRRLREQGMMIDTHERSQHRRDCLDLSAIPCRAVTIERR